MREKKRPPSLEALYSGALGEIRTPYPLVRSQVLYPDELRARRDRNYTQTSTRTQGETDIMLSLMLQPIKKKPNDGSRTAQ